MTDSQPVPGAIAWHDLTVEDADRLRDFYAAVAGWKPAPVDMGVYADFNMLGPDGRPAAGICHARGINANLPPQWLVYIVVGDLAASLEKCEAMGGTLVADRRPSGGFCVIRDPAGAVCALYQAPATLPAG